MRRWTILIIASKSKKRQPPPKVKANNNTVRDNRLRAPQNALPPNHGNATPKTLFFSNAAGSFFDLLILQGIRGFPAYIDHRPKGCGGLHY
jgi:hypothetical protein